MVEMFYQVYLYGFPRKAGLLAILNSDEKWTVFEEQEHQYRFMTEDDLEVKVCRDQLMGWIHISSPDDKRVKNYLEVILKELHRLGVKT